VTESGFRVCPCAGFWFRPGCCCGLVLGGGFCRAGFALSGGFWIRVAAGLALGSVGVLSGVSGGGGIDLTVLGLRVFFGGFAYPLFLPKRHGHRTAPLLQHCTDTVLFPFLPLLPLLRSSSASAAALQTTRKEMYQTKNLLRLLSSSRSFLVVIRRFPVRHPPGSDLLRALHLQGQGSDRNREGLCSLHTILAIALSAPPRTQTVMLPYKRTSITWGRWEPVGDLIARDLR